MAIKRYNFSYLLLAAAMVLLCGAFACAPARARAGEAGETPALIIDCPRVQEYAARPGTLTLLFAGESYETPVTVKYRGGYSRLFTLKRNYALHLKTAQGAQEKRSLLGLRTDDDWLLDGALNDPSRLRSRVALDIWNDLAGGVPRGAACEVTVSGYYKGVYILNERPDRKSAGVSKQAGFLYRTVAPAVNGVNALDCDGAAAAPGQQAQAGDSWYNVECVYAPAGEAAFSRLWAVCAALSSARAAGDAAFAVSAADTLDLPALADYYLFVNACAGSDNMAKNMYIAFTDGQSKLKFLPWDMDAAFGRLYNAQKSAPQALYANALYDRLLALPDFQSLLRARWAEIKALFAPESVMARFRAYSDPLEASGAWAREAQKNPVYTDVSTGESTPFDIAGELAYIAEFARARYDFMNARFGQ